MDDDSQDRRLFPDELAAELAGFGINADMLQAAELDGFGFDPDRVPAEIHRPAAVAAWLSSALVTRFGWASPPTVIVPLWARRTPLNAPDTKDVSGGVAVLDPPEDIEGVFDTVAALRRFVARKRPKAPAGRLFFGLVVIAEGLHTDEEGRAALKAASAGADAANVHDDLVAAGRASQYLAAVASLVNGWRFEVIRHRVGEPEFVSFPPGQPWAHSHSLADAVVEATMTYAAT